MKNTGTLRIQAFAARQSAPVEGVTVAVQGKAVAGHGDENTLDGRGLTGTESLNA